MKNSVALFSDFCCVSKADFISLIFLPIALLSLYKIKIFKQVCRNELFFRIFFWLFLVLKIGISHHSLGYWATQLSNWIYMKYFHFFLHYDDHPSYTIAAYLPSQYPKLIFTKNCITNRTVVFHSTGSLLFILYISSSYSLLKNQHHNTDLDEGTLLSMKNNNKRVI